MTNISAVKIARSFAGLSRFLRPGAAAKGVSAPPDEGTEATVRSAGAGRVAGGRLRKGREEGGWKKEREGRRREWEEGGREKGERERIEGRRG